MLRPPEDARLSHRPSPADCASRFGRNRNISCLIIIKIYISHEDCRRCAPEGKSNSAPKASFSPAAALGTVGPNVVRVPPAV